MTIEQLRIAYHAEPFRPFLMHLTDGRVLEVRQRDFLSCSPSGRTAVVHHPDDRFSVVDLSQVTGLEPAAPPGPGFQAGPA